MRASIDFEREQVVSISDAAKLVPGRPALRTVWRWVERGVGGVRLESIKVGHRRFTSVEAIRRFIQATTEARDDV